MKYGRLAVTWIVVAVMIGAAFASECYAYGPNSGDRLLLASFPVYEPFAASASTTPAPVGLSLTPEMAVLTRQGISPARAMQALSLQRKVAETHLAHNIEAALAGAYAGVWFEPAAAKFHIGVTSNASRQAAKRIVAQAGLTANVVETPVRSTWAALIAAQNHWNERLTKLRARAQATTGLDSSRNAVSVTLSSSVPSPERAVLEGEAAAATVNVSITVVSPSQLRAEPKVKCPTEMVPTLAKAYCEKTITSGVRIVVPGAITGQGVGKTHLNTTIDGFALGILDRVELGDLVSNQFLLVEAHVTYMNSTTEPTAVGISANTITDASEEFTFGRKLSCTAGPMLIEGNETYMLTAGHCFGRRTPVGGEAITEEVFSEYPNVVGEREIGKVGYRYDNEGRDIAEVKVARPGAFTEALPDPVPALMAEWRLENPEKPHAVEGVEQAEVVPGQIVCHEGQASGEHCGEITMVNTTLFLLAEHLVEITACSNKGDSGGPYFFRNEAGRIFMEGTEVGGPREPDCSQSGPYKSYFEPLLGLSGAPSYGILSTFAQKLLTTANEVRESGWLVGGVGALHEEPVDSEGEVTLEDMAGLGGSDVIDCKVLSTGDVGSTSGIRFDKILSVAFEGCAILGGPCTSLDNVAAVNLPWLSEVVLSGSTFLDLFESGGSGEPGYLIECVIFAGILMIDKCVKANSTLELENLTTEKPKNVEALLNTEEKWNCTQSGSEGLVHGELLVLDEQGLDLEVSEG